jgi:hypothetical protein
MEKTLTISAALDELKELLGLLETHATDYQECDRRNKRIIELCDYLDEMDRKGTL